MYRTIAETDPEQIRQAGAQFDVIVARPTRPVRSRRAGAGLLRLRSRAQRDRTNRFVAAASEARRLAVAGQKEAALKVARETSEPIFATLGIEGTKLGDSIEAYMRKRSSDLTAETNATRYSLIGFGAFGLVFGIPLLAPGLHPRHHRAAQPPGRGASAHGQGRDRGRDRGGAPRR